MSNQNFSFDREIIPKPSIDVLYEAPKRDALKKKMKIDVHVHVVVSAIILSGHSSGNLKHISTSVSVVYFIHEKQLPLSICHLSRVMRKPTFCICEYKDADQLRGNLEADQRLYFCYLDSTIHLLTKSEISSL